MRLGGWQRLWVVFAVICAIPVGFFTVTEMPKASEYEWRRYRNTDELITNETTREVKMPDGIGFRNVPKGIPKQDLKRLYDLKS